MAQWSDPSEVEQQWSSSVQPDQQQQSQQPAASSGWADPEQIDQQWQQSGAADRGLDDGGVSWGSPMDALVGVGEGLGMLGSNALEGIAALRNAGQPPGYRAYEQEEDGSWQRRTLKPVEDTILHKTSEYLRDVSVDETREQSVARTVGQIGGSVGGFGLTAILSGGAAAPGLLGLTSGAGDFYNDAKEHGADEEDALNTSLIGSAAGLTNVLPAGALLQGLQRSGGKATTRFLTGLTTNTLTEGGQEAFYEWMKNLSARDFIGYDPERPLTENLATAAGAGGGAGAFMYSLARLMGVRTPAPFRTDEIRQAEQDLRAERGLSEDDEFDLPALPPPSWSSEFVADSEGAVRQLTESEAEAQTQYRTEQWREMEETGLTPDVRRAQSRLIDNIRAAEENQQRVEEAGAAEADPQVERQSLYQEAFDALEQQDRQQIEQDLQRASQDMELQDQTAFSAYIDRIRQEDLSRFMEETAGRVEEINEAGQRSAEYAKFRASIEAMREGAPRNPIMAERLRAAMSMEAEREKDATGVVNADTARRVQQDREVEFAESSRQRTRDIDHVREVHSTPVESNLTDAENDQYAELDFKAQFEPDEMSQRDWDRYERLMSKAQGESYTSGRRALTTAEKDQIANDLESGRRNDLLGTDPNDEGVRFSQRGPDESAPRGMATDQLRGVIQRITARWPNAPAVRVVRRQRDLPARLRKRADDLGIVSRAVYDGQTQTVYMIARNIDNAQQAARTLMHEGIGHHGLRRSLGVQIEPHLLALYRRHRAEAEQIAADYKINTSSVDGKMKAAEELLARRAEGLSQSPFVQAIKDMLRRVGEAIGIRLRDSDIMNMLKQARRFVEGRRVRVPQAGRTRTPEQGLGEDAARRAFTQANTRRINAQLQEALGHLRSRDQQVEVSELQAANDTFSGLMRRMFNLTQVTKRNPHIEALQTYTDLVRQWNSARMNWVQRANDTIVEWEHLGPERAGRVGDLLFDQTVEGRFFSDEEIAQYGLDGEQMQVYERVREDFRDFLDQMEEAHLNDIRRGMRGQSEEAINAAVQEARTEFQAMRVQPYFPLPRFGRYAVRGVATEEVTYQGQTYEAGDLVWFRTYDYRLQRTRNRESDLPSALRNKVRLGDDIISDVAQDLLSFPPQLRHMVERKLEDAGQLTDEQRQQLVDLSNQLAPTASFRNRMRRRKGVPGFNEDATRGYAQYFSSGANHIARTMFQNPMTEAIQQVEQEASEISRAGGSGDRRREIAGYMRDHQTYNLNPENEWSGLRSLGFNWYLGFNPRSAMVNLTQIPLITYPYLAARHGDAQSVKQLSRAYKDVTQYLTRRSDALSEEEAAALQRAAAEGFIDESMAQVLASVADGYNLSNALSSTAAGRRMRQFSYASSWLFTKVEQLNRRVSLIAAMRLAREKGLSYEQAYREGRAAVENTQYEYARWNRPEFMRGKKSVIFLFFQYMQNTAEFMFGGDKGATRAWVMYLMAGGVLGLPFVENILDLVDGLASYMFDRKVDTRLSARQLLAKWGDQIEKELGSDWLAAPFNNPDLILRGASRYAFGHLDFSGSISMGRPIPGTTLFIPRGEMTAYQMWYAQQDILGAVAGVPMGVWQAISSDHPDTWKRAEQAMPTILKSFSTAARRAYRGEVTNWQGVRRLEYDLNDPLTWIEIGGRAMGAEPTRIRQMTERDRIKREHTQYWNHRRSLLLSQYDYLNRTGQDTAPVRKAIRSFNKDVPYPEMRLGPDSIRQSLRNRARRRAQEERGIEPQRMYRRMGREIEGAFPEVSPSEQQE